MYRSISKGGYSTCKVIKNTLASSEDSDPSLASIEFVKIKQFGINWSSTTQASTAGACVRHKALSTRTNDAACIIQNGGGSYTLLG